MLRIHDNLAIPEDELNFVASRSAGPGGQHVNKVNSRITLIFDLDGSTSLSEEDKERIRQRFASRINKSGQFRVSAQKERSQILNRRRATERFVELLQLALEEVAERKPTKVPRRTKRRRLADKKHRGELKRHRQSRPDSE